MVPAPERRNAEHDVGQARGRSFVRRDARQYPGAALLVHEAACAIEWVDQQSPAAILLSGAARKHERLGEAFRDEANGLVARDGGEPAHERRLADAVDGVDRIAFVARRLRELLRRLPRARVHDVVADRGMQGLDWL